MKTLVNVVRRPSVAHAVALFGAALALGSGCTITTYSGGSPSGGNTPQTKEPRTETPGRRGKAPAKSKPGSGPRVPKFTSGGSGSGSGATKPSPGAATAPTITSANLFGNGTGGRFRGLAYVVPQGTAKLPDFNSLVPFATLYTNTFNVKEQEFSGGFPGALVQEEWFAIRFEGKFNVPKAGNYDVKLTSDDGANLYLDGKKVLDNDGVHGAKTAQTRLPLGAGAHELRLEYFQASKGKVALQLSIAMDGKADLLAQ